jgi:quercetin dioxygenase-like cupin family protein
MRAVSLLLLTLPTALVAQAQSFGVCKPVAERQSDIGCWILTDKSVGRAKGSEVYWHLDTYRDSVQAERASGGHGVVVRALGKTWLMTIARARPAVSHSGTHVASIGPLHVKPGTEYSALFMEAIFTPGMTSAVHRHSGPEAWYTVAGETCLETPQGKIVSSAGHPAVVPQGPPMFLTATGKNERRAITLILHDAKKAPTTMETKWKPRGLCK